MKVVTSGGLRVDYLITPEGEAHVGLPGGNALYAAVGAALWTDQVGLWARIGANYPPGWLEHLAQRGLDTAGLVRLPSDQDHRTFFAYLPDGRRDDTHPEEHFRRIQQPLPLALQGYVHSTPNQDNPNTYEPLAIQPDDWPPAYKGVKAVQLSPNALRSHLFIPGKLRQSGVKTVTLDPGERYMTPALSVYLRSFLPAVDAFLPSDQEIRSLFGSQIAVEKAASILCEWGARIAVIKLGPEGVFVQEQNGRAFHLPPYYQPGSGEVVDVTGAGDAFCGGFMVGLAQSNNALTAAKMGLVSASFALEGYGALYALGVPRQAARERLLVINQRQEKRPDAQTSSTRQV